MPMPDFVGWNQEQRAARDSDLNAQNMLTNIQMRQQLAPFQTDLLRAQAAKAQADAAKEQAVLPYAAEIARVPIEESRRKATLDKLRSEAADRKNEIAKQLADARTEAVRLSGDINAPGNRVKIASSIAQIESLQDRMNHESRLENQYLFGAGLSDSPFSPNTQSGTLNYLKGLLQQPTAPSAPPSSGQSTAPQVRGPQGQMVTTDEQGRRVVIPPEEQATAAAAFDAGNRGEQVTMRPPMAPQTAPVSDQLTAPRQPVAVPADLMALPVKARMDTFNKRMAEVPVQTAHINSAAASLDNVADTARLILNHPSLSAATGITGTITTKIPGFGPYNVQQIIDSLEAKLAFASLGDLRSQSKTGGALGQVSDREEAMLQKAIASVKLAQNETDVKRALQDVINYSVGAKDRLIKAYEQTYAQPPDLTRYNTITQKGQQPSREGGGQVSYPTATGPKGEKIMYKDGKWQPM